MTQCVILVVISHYYKLPKFFHRAMKDDGSVTTQPGSGPRLLLGCNEKEPGKFLFEFNGDSVSWTNQIPVALVLTK